VRDFFSFKRVVKVLLLQFHFFLLLLFSSEHINRRILLEDVPKEGVDNFNAGVNH
jgi:hypothetical protein